MFMHRREIVSPTAATTTERTHQLTLAEQLLLSVLWLGINAQSAALLPIVIPLQILLFVPTGSVGDAQQATFLGWFSAGGAVVTLIIPPVIGALSDRTTSVFGRRRPYIAVGAVVLLLADWELATARDVIGFTLAFLLSQVAINIAIAAYQGFVPDRVSESQRGAASGYLGLMTIFGNVGSLALAAWLFSNVNLDAPSQSSQNAIITGSYVFYAITAIIFALTTAVTLFGVPETPLTATSTTATVSADSARSGALAAQVRWRAWLSPWIDPWKSRNFVWVFLTRGFVMLGLTLFLTFIEYYFAHVLHIANYVQATAAVAMLALVGAVFSALTLGILSDRIGRVSVVGFSTACMALPAVAFIVLPQGTPLWPLGLLFGLGYGAYTSVDWALAIDALPSLGDAGKDLGLWSAATTLPAILAPALGALTLNAAIGLLGVNLGTTFGYQLIMGLAALFLPLGAVCVVFIREERRPLRPAQPPTLDESDAPAGGPSSVAPLTDAETVAHTATHGRRGERRLAFGWRLAGRSHAGKARSFLRFWPVWERIMQQFFPITPIPNAPYGLFEVHVMRYHGRPIDLPDGTHIKRGDTVVELHINNHAMPAVRAQVTSFALLGMLEGDLAALATWTEAPDVPESLLQGKMRNVKALYGLTLLSRGAPRLGFTVRPVPRTIKNRLDRFFMLGLLTLYHPGGLNRLAHGSTRATYPQQVWMSRATLLRRYGSQSMTDDSGD
ncbi:MAG: MFS transporter [Ktedonobacterales bacterium]